MCLQITGYASTASRLLTRTHRVRDWKTHKDDNEANYPQMYSQFSAWQAYHSTYYTVFLKWF